MLQPAAHVDIDRAETLGRLRAEVAAVETRAQAVASLPFGLADIDGRLMGGGLEGAGLHEIAAASSGLNDDAAATLFVAGIAARFADAPGAAALWALTRFDLYAPGLEQAGLGPERAPRAGCRCCRAGQASDACGADRNFRERWPEHSVDVERWPPYRG